MTKRSEIPSSTNSPTGSYHWFMTLMSRHLHMGEYIQMHGELSPDLLKAWGDDLYKTSQELITWFHNTHETRDLQNIDMVIDNLKALLNNLEDARSSS